MEPDGAVYCAILRTPHVASRFVSDPFTLFPPPSSHHIRDGFIGIRHLARISRALFPDRVQLPSRTVTNLEKAGFKTLDSIGRLFPDPIPPTTYTFSPSFSSSPTSCARDWPILLRRSQALPFLISHIYQPSPSSLYFSRAIHDATWLKSISFPSLNLIAPHSLTSGFSDSDVRYTFDAFWTSSVAASVSFLQQTISWQRRPSAVRAHSYGLFFLTTRSPLIN